MTVHLIGGQKWDAGTTLKYKAQHPQTLCSSGVKCVVCCLCSVLSELGGSVLAAVGGESCLVSVHCAVLSELYGIGSVLSAWWQRLQQDKRLCAVQCSLLLQCCNTVNVRYTL